MVRVYRNLGGGVFEPGPGYHTMDQLQSLTVGDIDGDGRPDVLAPGAGAWIGYSWGPGLHVLMNRGGGRLSSLAEYALPSPSIVRTVHLGGPLDDLVVAADGFVMLMVNRQANGFAAPVKVATGSILAVRDLDRDGLDDVLVQTGDTLRVLQGAVGHTLVPGAWSLAGYWFFALGEFTADGVADLVLHDALGSLFLAAGAGDGGFDAPQSTGAARPYDSTYGLRPAVGNGVDLDRDGVDELVVFQQRAPGTPELPGGHSPDTVVVYRAGPTVTLTSIASCPVPWPPDSKWWWDGPHQVLPADFDGDGWLDLLAFRWGPSAPGTYGSYAVLMNQGDGSLAVSEYDWVQIETSEAAIVDLNGDLRDDVVFSAVHSDDTGWLYWRVSKGDGTFTEGRRNDLGDYLTSVTIGHFDSDARPDLAIIAKRNGYVGVIMNTTLWPDASTPVLASLVSASVEAGTAHLAWRVDDASAEAVVLRNDDGATWTERARLRPAGDGSVRFDDAGLAPGAHVGYRLAFLERGALVTASETWLDVPAAARLALAGAAPNPVAGDLMVAFSLAERTRGTLALFDLAGRRLAEHDLSALAAGEHRVRLAPAGTIAPGLYFIRLTSPQRTLTARAVVVE